MSQFRQILRGGELQVMKLLWSHGEMTARKLAESMPNRIMPPGHGTMQSVLRRLEKKGYVSHDRSAYEHLFRPRIMREDYALEQLKMLLDEPIEDSLLLFTVRVLTQWKFSPKEWQIIRELLSRNRKPATPAGKRSKIHVEPNAANFG
jgi:predicted transcriptional regulator